MEIDKEHIKIQLWDTAGQEQFPSRVQHYYHNMQSVVFVYDLASLVSFHSLPSWIEECIQHLLTAVKCHSGAHRLDPEIPGHAQYASVGDLHDYDHVEAIFLTLTHKLKSHRPLMLSQPPTPTPTRAPPEAET